MVMYFRKAEEKIPGPLEGPTDRELLESIGYMGSRLPHRDEVEKNALRKTEEQIAAELGVLKVSFYGDQDPRTGIMFRDVEKSEGGRYRFPEENLVEFLRKIGTDSYAVKFAGDGKDTDMLYVVEKSLVPAKEATLDNVRTSKQVVTICSNGFVTAPRGGYASVPVAEVLDAAASILWGVPIKPAEEKRP